jgi:hypothetical protein
MTNMEIKLKLAAKMKMKRKDYGKAGALHTHVTFIFAAASLSTKLEPCFESWLLCSSVAQLHPLHYTRFFNSLSFCSLYRCMCMWM